MLSSLFPIQSSWSWYHLYYLLWITISALIIPIHVIKHSHCINMLTLLNIELTVIMLWIICTMFATSSIMFSYFHLRLLSKKFAKRNIGLQPILLTASKLRQIIPSRIDASINPTGQGCRPWPAQEFRLLHYGYRLKYIFLYPGKEDIF